MKQVISLEAHSQLSFLLLPYLKHHLFYGLGSLSLFLFLI